MRVFVLTLVAILPVLLFTGSSSAQLQDLPTPGAPLALPSGKSVQLAWSLPAAPRAETVVIYRSSRGGAQFDEVARVAAGLMRYMDEGVELGENYQYRIQIQRGVRASALSGPADVRVGGGSRIGFIGGSVERALFEVVMYQRGRRISARFVHKPGDAIGDLVYLADADVIEDFRLGPRLLRLEIGNAVARTTDAEDLKTAAGAPMKDLGGRPLTLDFEFPGQAREVVIATIVLPGGREIRLNEGETWQGN